MKVRPFHGPDLQYGLLPFQMTASGILRTSKAKEKLPVDGSEAVFHEVNSTFSVVLLLEMSFMGGKNELEGCLKLSHMTNPEAGSSKTRLPESRIRAVVLAVGEVTFEDQRTVWFPFETTRFPSLEIVKIPEESWRGLFAFATHTMVCKGIWLYQIPTYRAVELSGVKNPNWKELPFEVMVAGSLMKLSDVIESLPKHIDERRRRNEKAQMFLGFICVAEY